MTDTGLAAAHARALLAPSLPSRFAHVEHVASCVGEVCAALGLDDATLTCAAWLHDVGYSPQAMDTGLHALDGARYASRSGFGPEVANLIAHHSCAVVEAELRGVGDHLARDFSRPDPTSSLILTAADMWVGPAGVRMSVDERLADIRWRYPPDHVVHRFVDIAEPDLRRACSEVRAWLGQSQ